MLTERGKQVRRAALKLMRENGLTHIGGSLSCTEILIALYDHVMTKDDVFIMSKGHGCGAWYVLLREQGYSPKIEVHPHKDVKNGIHFTSGSLGHGLPFAIGVALAKKLKGDKGKVFVLCGDGETEEGSYSECSYIMEKIPDLNLCIIVDYNGYTGSGKFTQSFNEFIDGHNVADLIEELNSDRSFVAQTTKASGISFLENTVRSHSTWLTEDEYKAALNELI